jgi:hypothetical protein
MAAKTKGNAGAGKAETMAITFKCRLCEKDKPLEDMRTVTRFVPVLVVCRDCAKKLR